MGIPNVLAILDAVERAHDTAGLSNPVRCALPRLALEQIVKVEPPRSWSKDAKAEWSLLPVDIRQTISQREEQRDSWFRREQNRAAEERKALANGASKSDGDIQKEGTNHVNSQA